MITLFQGKALELVEADLLNEASFIDAVKGMPSQVTIIAALSPHRSRCRHAHRLALRPGHQGETPLQVGRLRVDSSSFVR